MHECANPSATPRTRDISIPRLTKCCFTHVPMSHHLSLFVSPSLQYASNPPFLPQNLSFFIPRNPGPTMAHKIRTFRAPILEWETSLRRVVPEAIRIWPSSSLQHRLPSLLQRAKPQRGSPRYCVPKAIIVALLCCFLFFGSFFIVSFLFYPDIDMSYKTL